jgi:hypothetical protein
VPPYRLYLKLKARKKASKCEKGGNRKQRYVISRDATVALFEECWYFHV